MSGIVSDLLPQIDSILGIRDTIGAALKVVNLVTRTWTGSERGDGTYTDVRVRVLPSPHVKILFDEYKVQSGGAFQQGDIILKAISKNSYPNKSDVDCTTSAQNIEKYYEVGGFLYRVIGVTERHVTWEVQLRKVAL